MIALLVVPVLGVVICVVVICVVGDGGMVT